MDMTMTFLRRSFLAAVIALAAPVIAFAEPKPSAQGFTIAVLPDTQNYMDYKKQRAEGFPFDSREMFFDQMGFIARNTKSAGGDIAFITMVGDIWQHPSLAFDAVHAAEGLKPDPSNAIVARYAPTEAGVAIEQDAARSGFEMISGKVPFSAVPGNHDYDAFWADSRFPAKPDTATPFGQLHYGGLTNFNEVFGADTPFFRGQNWYVDSYNGGANSAQVFEAGGYRFLHIGLEMAPYDNVLAWASRVVERYKGLPTIVTIHDHLTPRGERKASPTVDFKAVQAAHNNPEDVWTKFLSRHNQIFLVLSGHQYGQSRRVDAGASGGKVWQILADFQERAQSIRAIDPEGKVRGGTGDGWMRLMQFDFSSATPALNVRTYSTYYNAYSSDLPTYAQWYRPHEQPNMTDQEFLAQDEFTISLDDFRSRFGTARIERVNRR
jgi:hypothetical protein